jgi:hypothetical protein
MQRNVLSEFKIQFAEKGSRKKYPRCQSTIKIFQFLLRLAKGGESQDGIVKFSPLATTSLAQLLSQEISFIWAWWQV